MPNFRCQVVTPTRELFNGEVSYAEIPGEIGNFGILAGHEKIVATNRPGVAILTMPDGKEKISFVLYEGVTQMVDDRLIIMGRMGAKLDEIDVQEVQAKADEMRATIAELEPQAANDEAAEAKLEIAQTRLGWYETQLSVVR